MLIDAGNSRLKWAWLSDIEQEDLLEASGSISNASESIKAITYRNDDKLLTIKALLDTNKPKRICIVHVLGETFAQELSDYCLNHHIQCRSVESTRTLCGVTNGYDQEKQLGADRLVALIGAYHLYPEHPITVIDAGTAVTIDAITSKGHHLGGVIMPGLQLWSDTLIKNTQLPLSSIVDIANDANVFSNDTKKGINSGSLYGLSGAIHHVCNVMDEKKRVKLTHKSNASMDTPINTSIRIICGGNSQQLSEYLPSEDSCFYQPYRVIPDLVMQGLIIIEKQ